MKKIFKFAAVALILLSSLVSLGRVTPVHAEGQTYEIGVAIYQYNDNFMTLFRNELEKYFKELGEKDGNTYNLEFQDGKNDQATQTEQLNNFIAQG